MRSGIGKIGMAGLLLFFLVFPSCGEEESMFSIAPVGSMLGSMPPFFSFVSDHRRNANSHATLIEQSAAGDLQVKDLQYLQVIGNKPQFQTTAQGDLADAGFPSGLIVASADSYVGSPYLLARESTHAMDLIDTNKKTRYTFGSYIHGVFWIDDSGGSRIVGQALLINGGVATDAYGVATITSVNAVDYYDLDTKKSNSWTKMEGVFDNLPGGIQYFAGARNLRLFKWQRTSTDDYGATLVLIDADGKMKYLETGDITYYNDYRFSDKTTEFIGVFAVQNLQVRYFDYFVSSYAGGEHSHFCAIAQSSKDKSKYSMYAFRPNTTYSTIPHVDDVYAEGTCSVIHYARAKSPLFTAYSPWVTYHSAKNELSVAQFDQQTQDFETFVLAKGKSANWLFAEKVNSIATAGGNNNEIFILYNDDQSLKMAACNDWGRCGFDSSQ